MDDARIDSIRFGLVTVKSNNRKVLKTLACLQWRRSFWTHSFDLPRINLNNPDSRGNQLLSQGVCKASNRSFCGTIYGSSNVRFSSGNTSNVDDISCSTIRSLLENGQHRLGHVDQASNIGCEHDIKIFLCNFGSFGNTLNKAAI